MELLTNLLADLCMPVGVFWLLLLLGCVIALIKRRWRVATVFGLLVLIYWGVGATPLAPSLLADLEKPYLPSVSDTAPASAVIMLGGTMYPSPLEPDEIDFNQQIDRFFTALDLVKEGKAEAIVFGGARFVVKENSENENQRLKDWLGRWDVTPRELFLLPPSSNTREEALHARKLAEEQGWEQVLLVSSAWHLKRATATFQKAGLSVIPVGCDFQGHNYLLLEDGWHLVPRIEVLGLAHLYMHELVGWYYYQWQGWLTKS